MAGVAPEGFFRGFNIYDGCISGNDMGMQQRPYHRNCGCALHDKKSGKGHCTHVKTSVKNVNVSYPLRRVWSEGSSMLAMASNCHTSPPSSHFSSPLVDGGSAGGGGGAVGGGGIPRSKSQHHLSN